MSEPYEPYEIVMAHPNRNAVGNDLLGWLEAQLDAAGERPLLLTGTGDAFSAGLDLREVASFDLEAMEPFLRRFDALVTRLFHHPAPTVAWVNGHAIAGGAVLALCCDHRVAQDEPKLRIGLNEVAIGACYPLKTMRIVRYRLPAHHEEEVLLGARLYGARDALRLGLLDEVSKDAETLARKRLAGLAAHHPPTYATTKGVLRGGVTDVTPEDERRFAEVEVPLWASDEVKRRLLAVLGK